MNMNLRPKKDKNESISDGKNWSSYVNRGMLWKCWYFKAFSVSKEFVYISGHNLGGKKGGLPYIILPHAPLESNVYSHRLSSH